MTQYILDLTKEDGHEIYSFSPNGSPRLFHDKVGMTDRVIQNEIRKLSGKIFTLLDASITNEKQLKSIKDIIRNNIAETFGSIDNLCYGNQTTNYCNEQAEKMTEEELKNLPEVSLEEAIGL